ncbi:MAG: capsule biosynthesis protein [Pseudomonadota bacterium]
MKHDPQLKPPTPLVERVPHLTARLKRMRWFAIFVLLPSLLAALYYGFVAADIYVSESRFVIKAPDRPKSATGSLGSLLQGSGLTNGQEQSNEIIGFLRSRDALAQLSESVDIRAAYASEEADFLSRYPMITQSDTFESLYKYYGSMVSTQPDPETALMILRVKAYTPGEAQKINKGLLDLSERLVNRLNQRVNAKAIEEAEERVVQAQQRIRDARIQLGAYRNSSQILDPQQQGIGVLEVSNALITQELALRAQLAEIRRNAPEHPAIPALQDRVEGIAQQVARQTGRAVGTPDGIAAKITQYENLVVEQEFAEQALTAASAALEQARIEAKQQQFYLERVVEPNRPDAAILPARMRSILAVLFGTLCVYLVGWMLSVGVKEHSSED